MPDIQTAVPAAPAGPPPALHPMDPRRGEHLSPLFAAFLAWLLDLEPMTDPAIAGICIAGNSVLAATTDNPLFDAQPRRFRAQSARLGRGVRRRAGHGGGPRRQAPEGGPMSFPDLPANDCRHRAALDIVDPGASNPYERRMDVSRARTAERPYPPAGEAAA